MAAGVFLFVEVDDPTSRRSKASKPASQRYTREARKHVMRDIGLSRRKEKPAKAPRPRATSQELNLVGGPVGRLPRTQKDMNGEEEHAAMLKTNGATSEESLSPSVLQAAEEGMECLLPIIARNVGGYRQDPFVKYPVKLDYRARQLLDTREFVHPGSCHDLSRNTCQATRLTNNSPRYSSSRPASLQNRMVYGMAVYLPATRPR